MPIRRFWLDVIICCLPSLLSLRFIYLTYLCGIVGRESRFALCIYYAKTSSLLFWLLTTDNRSTRLSIHDMSLSRAAADAATPDLVNEEIARNGDVHLEYPILSPAKGWLKDSLCVFCGSSIGNDPEFKVSRSMLFCMRSLLTSACSESCRSAWSCTSSK